MKELFLPYHLSLLAKEKGFDEPCFATYTPELSGLPLEDMEGKPANALDYTWQNSKIHGTICTAPLYQQLVDWLREKHNLFIHIHVEGILPRWYDWDIESIEVEQWEPILVSNEEESYEDYYSCLQVAIEKAFTLI